MSLSGTTLITTQRTILAPCPLMISDKTPFASGISLLLIVLCFCCAIYMNRNNCTWRCSWRLVLFFSFFLQNGKYRRLGCSFQGSELAEIQSFHNFWAAPCREFLMELRGSDGTPWSGLGRSSEEQQQVESVGVFWDCFFVLLRSHWNPAFAKQHCWWVTFMRFYFTI